MKSQDLRLEIEYLPVDSLRPYDRNARKHADDDVDATREARAYGEKVT